MIYFLCGLLMIHGIVCLVGAFFPFYPPVYLFYAASQVVYGGHLLLKRRWQVRWHWLALTVVVFTGLLLIFPAFHGLFTPIPTATPEPPPYPSARPGPERPDDIVSTPGGPQYRANVHQQGVENPWPPIETKEEFLARNNIIRVVTPGRDIRSLNLYASNIPNVIEVKRGMEWHGSHSIAQVLIMEISQDVQPGQYTLEIGVEIDGKNYGKVPCIIKVTPETTPRPIPQQPAELPLRIISVTAETLPEAECYITIDYGPSGVQSLRPKTADGTGRVSWSWAVGNFRGTWEIMVKATYGGKTASKITLFTVR